MYLVLFVLHDAEKLEDLLDAWEEAGVSGVTILHSTGLGRARQGGGWRDDLPLIPSLKSLLHHVESFSRTLFTVVSGEALVDGVVEATQRVVGDLREPDTGLLVAVRLARVYGLDKEEEYWREA